MSTWVYVVYQNTTKPVKVFRKILLKIVEWSVKTNLLLSVYLNINMESCLGPTFANYNMWEIENTVIREKPECKPFLYARYVDDIFVATKDLSEVLRLKEELQNNSILRFTHEEEKDRRLAFLDCLVERMEDSFLTSVHIKDTNTGDCINYNGICPERYKIGIIKTFLHRGYHIWSTPLVYIYIYIYIYIHIYLQIYKFRYLETKFILHRNLLD